MTLLTECYKQILQIWFGEEKNKRKFIDKVIGILEHHWNDKNVFIIEAPTGYGKSTISATVSLFSVNNRDDLKCIVAFPLRTLLEDQYCKFAGEHEIRKESKEEILCKDNRGIFVNLDQKIRLDIIGKRYMYHPDSLYLIKPITLTTVDTLALTLFGIPPECIDSVVRAWSGTISGSLGHYLFSWSSVIFSNVILDEVHLLADSTKSLSFLIALMKIAKDFDQKLILMSATLPEALKSILKEHLSKKWIEFIEFDIDDDPQFCQERAKKDYDVVLESVVEQDKFIKILNWIKNNDFSKIIVIFNTVSEAIAFYEEMLNELEEIFSKNNIILLHSRFSERDRERKMEKLRNLKNKYLIISTQVIEAGVDISSDLFITDIAPANSLIQRLGRFLRYNEKKGKIIIWYEVDKNGELLNLNGRYKVYDYDLTYRTLNWLLRNSEDMIVNLNVHLPKIKESTKRGYKELLNYVYCMERRDKYFNVDRETIKDFEGIFLHLENASLIAIEKFFEMEGSFIREGMQIPLITKSVIEKSKDKEEIINLSTNDLIRNYIIPISFELIFNRRKKINIYGVIVEDITKEKGLKLKFIKHDHDPWLSSILNRLKKGDLSPKDILTYVFRRKVLAFVIDAKYNEELGLRFDKDA